MRKENNTFELMMRLRPNSVCIYQNRGGSISSELVARMRAQRKYDISMSRVISSTSIRKIKKAAEYLNYINIDKFKSWGEGKGKSHYRLVFVTLTLSSVQVHTDNEIKKICLQPFLENLQKTHGIRNYIWRAERQKNGNIHFHLIIDRWVEWWAIRNLWNKCQNKLGYVEAFAKIHNHFNPNSTDVSAILNSDAVKKYISKYISKNKSQDEISGRHWGCDYLLSRVQDYKIKSSSIKFAFILDYLRNFQNSKFECDHCTIYDCDLWNVCKSMLNRYEWDIFDEFKDIGWLFSDFHKCLIIDKNYQKPIKEDISKANCKRGVGNKICNTIAKPVQMSFQLDYKY